MNLAQWLIRTATRDATRPALFLGTDCVADYGTFHARAASVARFLVERGIAPGDRVALFMANVPEYLIAFYGAWIAGAAVVPVNAKLHGREAAWIVENAGASHIFATPKEAAGLGELTDTPITDVAGPDFASMSAGSGIEAIHRDPDDLAWLFYTSGTTGRPKGVKITHGMLWAMATTYFADVDEVLSDDATIYAAPMSHAAGINNMVFVLRGARHVHPVSQGFDATEVLDLARAFGSVSMFMAPTMVRRFTDAAKEREDQADGIRTILYAGGPMYLADIEEAVDWFGPKFAQVYGQGECPMSITALPREDVADRFHPRWRERLGSVGRAQSSVEVRIGNGQGGWSGPGEIGEIMVRGLPVMPGYWRNSEATAKTIVDGWLLTGDVGRLDEDGYLTLTDRSKDTIISGGSNIYPREVEEVLLSHEAVHEVSVVGQKDAEWGEVVVAFVVPTPGSAMDPIALDRHCLSFVARFKRPKRYIELAALPKNNYGKVLKTDLRRRLIDEPDT